MKTDKKTVLVIRHAKSSWELGIPSDFDRPLNERGRTDAPVMAKRLFNKKIAIDAFVSSPAKRAKQTCEFFCAQYKRNVDEIIFEQSLYHASAPTFFTVIEKLDDKLNTVAIFSHNAGLTDFVNQLVNNVRIDNVPTCGIFAVTAAIENWKDFSDAKKELLFFDYPKLA
ncbi:MAG TPA: histidine phosphatase family protein [Ferruginibacter sp.]|jgi:phosphohistidine phosphatase|nr:histidine phosphatase family protein [Ferruginibacter sp.]